MKYCTHCGKELLDEAVICPGCGCEVKKVQKAIANDDKVQKAEKIGEKPEGDLPFKKKKFSWKKTVLIVVLAVVLIGVVIGGIFVWNYIRTNTVKEQLADKIFYYYESNSYPALGTFEYNKKELLFDSEGQLLIKYYYSNINAGDAYYADYDISFRDGLIFLEYGGGTYEIRFDRYERLEGLIDINSDDVYELVQSDRIDEVRVIEE